MSVSVSIKGAFNTFPECELGFRSRKGTSCEPCEFDFFGEGCAYKCMCNVTQGCDKVNGCVEKYAETTRIPTTQSNMAKAISSEESFTKVHEEKETEGLSKTELLILFCGALSGIIVLLGILGISNCIKKRRCISKSKRKNTVEEVVDKAEEHATQETLELHESLYESIDDSHLDSILLPITFSSNLVKGYDSSSSKSMTSCNEDRARYQHSFTSLGTKESSCHKEEQSQNAIPSTIKSNCIVDQSLCSPYPPIEADDSGYEISVDCTYDRASYLHRNNTLVDNTAYCHISEVDKSGLLSE
ncbi:unnamed protein product [Mytilus coruscus]|uniref:MEGF10_11 n=1 Tax=Mytilus coruscus TaxID=42192 RepID=A0A6J8F368_MYTCO|nr:unnamed protein product [Mytilus coruscus]